MAKAYAKHQDATFEVNEHSIKMKYQSKSGNETEIEISLDRLPA